MVTGQQLLLLKQPLNKLKNFGINIFKTMTDETFEKAKYLKDDILRLERIKSRLQKSYNKVKIDEFDKEEILSNYSDFMVVLQAFKEGKKDEFKEL